MNTHLCLPFLPVCLAVAQETPQTEPTSPHYMLARNLIALLEETEKTLDTCMDEESIRAALPTLRTLGTQMNAIAVRQAELPDPTAEEEREVMQLKEQFNFAWKAVVQQIDRLISGGLVTAELANVLALPPETIAKPAAPTS